MSVKKSVFPPKLKEERKGLGISEGLGISNDRREILKDAFFDAYVAEDNYVNITIEMEKVVQCPAEWVMVGVMICTMRETEEEVITTDKLTHFKSDQKN